jgi:hypothetical protein
MVGRDLKSIILIYSIVLILVLFLSLKFRDKFWFLFSAVLFPLISLALITYNLVRFPAFNRVDIPPYFQARLQRLSSKDLIELFDNSITKARSGWIYTLVEIYYQGRTLLIPEDYMEFIELSLEKLQAQGRLIDVQTIELNYVLTESRIELIQELDFSSLSTREGDLFYFVTQEKDQNSPLLLLKYGDMLIFIPQDLLPENEGDL